MKVRSIEWYRTAAFSAPESPLLSLVAWGGWYPHILVPRFGVVRTREEFEKQYWEWKVQNEG